MNYYSSELALSDVGMDMATRTPQERKTFGREVARLVVMAEAVEPQPQDSLSPEGRRIFDRLWLLRFGEPRQLSPECAAQVTAWQAEARANAQKGQPQPQMPQRRRLFACLFG
jgi:hypothetical protein